MMLLDMHPRILRPRTLFYSTKSLKICGCKRWCPKDQRVCAPAAPMLMHSLIGTRHQRSQILYLKSSKRNKISDGLSAAHPAMPSITTFLNENNKNVKTLETFTRSLSFLSLIAKSVTRIRKHNFQWIIVKGISLVSETHLLNIGLVDLWIVNIKPFFILILII